MALVRSKFIMLNPSCLIKCFLWSLLLILQGCCPFPGSNGSCTKGHYRPKIEKNTTLYNLRMEMIKRDLVEKMGLQEARAKDTPPNHIPDAILKEFWAETERYDAREQTESSRQVKKLMVHAKKASTDNCKGCVKFFHRSSSLQTKLARSDLWIYLKEPIPTVKTKSIVEIQIIDEKKISKSLVGKKTIAHPKVGWYRINLHDITNWTSPSRVGYLQVDLLLQIACVDCNLSLDGETLPYLELSEETIVKRRMRRSAKCTSSATSCCLDTFEIEFQKYVGDLAAAIILPKSVNVGQCRGTCDTPHVAADAHSGIVRSTKIKKSNMNLCCVPNKYKSFATLIFNGTDEIVIRNINDMVVSECGCA